MKRTMIAVLPLALVAIAVGLFSITSSGPGSPTGNSALAVVSSVTDYDGDRCPDLAELGLDRMKGGDRDPKNPWDWFEPTHDGVNSVSDILAVVQQYGRTVGSPGYNQDMDRTSGGDLSRPWLTGPPNGSVRVDDILLSVHQYGSRCASEPAVPEGLQFITGATSADQLNSIITGDLRPFLEAAAAGAGSGGAAAGAPAGVKVGQTIGDYRVSCVYPDGGFEVVPVNPPPVPSVVPTDNPADAVEEESNAAPVC